MNASQALKIRGLIDQLNTLTEKERGLVFNYFSNTMEVPEQVEKDEAIEFYSILQEILKNRFSIISPPYSTFIKLQAKNTIISCRKTLIEFYCSYHKLKNENILKRDFYKFVQFYVNISRYHCIAINVPVSLKTILNQHTNLSGMLEKAFPSYIKSRMLSVILALT